MARMADSLLAAVFVGTLVALYLRPFGAKDWQVAGVGGALAWAVGPLSFDGGLSVLRDSLNILAFFLGLMLLAAGAEASGLYARAAGVLAAARSPRQSVGVVVVLAALVTAVLSNDATPLVLTPAIFAALGRDGRGLAGAAFAATFVADGGSLLLPVSNPVNLLFFEKFQMSFGEYATNILPAAAAGVLVMGVYLVARTPGDPGSAPGRERARPVAANSGWLGTAAIVVVALLSTAYLAAGVAGLPLGAVTLGGGMTLCALCLIARPREAPRFREHIAPGLLVFVAGLLLLVAVVAQAGLLDRLADLFGWLEAQPTLVAIFGAAVIAAVLSNVMNNWPAALLVSAAIAVSPGTHAALVAGALIGCTIGANFTMVGSLSTVFWLSLCRQRGAAYSPLEYIRRAAAPTTLGMVGACLVAAVTVR